MWRVTWWNKLHASTIHVSQDILGIQTDCFVILSCYTAGNSIAQFCDRDQPHLQSEAMQVNLQVEGAVLHDGGWHFSNWFLCFGLNSAPKLQQNWTGLVCALELPAFSRKKATEVLTTSGCIKSHGAILEEEVLTPMSWSNNNSSNLILPVQILSILSADSSIFTAAFSYLSVTKHWKTPDMTIYLMQDVIMSSLQTLNTEKIHKS